MSNSCTPAGPGCVVTRSAIAFKEGTASPTATPYSPRFSKDRSFSASPKLTRLRGEKPQIVNRRCKPEPLAAPAGRIMIAPLLLIMAASPPHSLITRQTVSLCGSQVETMASPCSSGTPAAVNASTRRRSSCPNGSCVSWLAAS